MPNDEELTKEPVDRKGDPDSEDKPFRVEDRRHWAREQPEDTAEEPTAESTHPAIVEAYRRRAEAAEEKLQEYIAAFKETQAEQEQFRERLARDVDRKVSVQFGSVLSELLESLDDLDLALAHVREVPEAGPLAEGVRLARERFLGTLQRHGVEPIPVDGEPFDPNVAEAVRVDSVDEASRDGVVVETVRAGYRLGDRVIRPARVAVGKLR